MITYKKRQKMCIKLRDKQYDKPKNTAQKFTNSDF